MTIPFTATVTEGPHAGGYIVSEANGLRSREGITILGGVGAARVLTAGMVIAQVTSGEWVQFDPSSADPPYDANAAAGILYDDVTAAVGVDSPGVAHVRACEVNQAELVWLAGVTEEQKTAALAQLIVLGIIPR